MIQLNNLTKYFDKLTVLKGINLEIADGESLAIIGPSGCGKSTLLKLLIRLEEPTSGSVNIDRQDIARLSDEGLMRLRKKVGMVFQSSALFDSMNVFENVAFALRLHTDLREREIHRKVMEKLAMVELEGTEGKMPDELSGGMRRRVSVARTLASDPKVILYDEPTTGLDPITSVTIEDLMIKLSRELKVTSIVVTHVLQTVYRTTNRILMLHEGKFIETGTPEETQKSKDPVVKKFITGGL
ncbi:MAG: ABC transporter ATP-binding protein [Candidatus Margulisbacteria bacterium]|nr:ABC transporter ATP-binding protein [Candidatus Margulisiibacteriota bacterium]